MNLVLYLSMLESAAGFGAKGRNAVVCVPGTSGGVDGRPLYSRGIRGTCK